MGWQPMSVEDLSAVYAMSKVVHPAFPEDFPVLAEKAQLFPAGSFFAPGAGYALSHPWSETPPALNRSLGRLPARPSLYYLHDIALLPSARHSGLGGAIVARLKGVAAGLGLDRLALVAVSGSAPFWRKQGFETSFFSPEKLASYGHDARYMTCRISASAP